jgi:hypothetical protein
VTLTPGRIELALEDGEPIDVEVRGEVVALILGGSEVREVPSAWVDASEQPPRTPAKVSR